MTAGKAPAGNAAAPVVKPIATKAAPKTPAAAGQAADAASGLAVASPRVRKATTPRQNAFNSMSLDIMRVSGSAIVALPVVLDLLAHTCSFMGSSQWLDAFSTLAVACLYPPDVILMAQMQSQRLSLCTVYIKVSGCVVLCVQDPFTSQAAEEQPGAAADAAGGAAQNAAAAEHRPSATAAALAFRARQTGGHPTTRLWPIKCRVEAAGPTFRYVSSSPCLLVGISKHASMCVGC